MSRTKNLSKTRAQAGHRPHPKALPRTGPSVTGQNAILCAALAAVTIALYSPVIGHSFIVWDDQDYVTANPHIHDGLSWSTIKWAFTSTAAANWHPLTWLSHAFDYQLFALNPAGHHLDSILIHALNAVLLFLLLEWITKRAGPVSYTHLDVYKRQDKYLPNIAMTLNDLGQLDAMQNQMDEARQCYQEALKRCV